MFITLLVFQMISVARYLLEPSFFKFSFFSRLNKETLDDCVMIFVDFVDFDASVTLVAFVERRPPACRDK